MARLKKKRATLTGWWKSVPLLLLPFSILFTEAWLHTQILAREYEQNDLREVLRKTDGQIDVLRDASHELNRMERMERAAPDLGLLPPAPGQVIEIHASTIPMNESEVALQLAQKAIRDVPGE